MNKLAWITVAICSILVESCSNDSPTPILLGESTTIIFTDSAGSNVQSGTLSEPFQAGNLFTFNEQPKGLFVANGFYYCIVNSRIVRGDVAGNTVPAVIFDETDDLLNPTSLAVTGSTLYLIDSGTQSLKFGNVDGSGTLSDAYENDDIGVAYSVLVDGNILYWADSNANAIYSTDYVLNSAPAKLFDTSTFIESPRGFVIYDGKIYISDFSTSSISAGNVDGSGTLAVLYSLPEGVDKPIGINVDPVAGKIYWTESGLVNRIRRANLDGSGSIETLYENVLSSNIGLVQ